MVTQLKTLWNHHQVQNARSEFESYIAAVLATLTRDLFSASKEFWTYHLSGIGVLLVLVLTINSILTASELLEFYAIASATWAAGLLVAGLILRSHYKNAEWETQSQAMVLIKTIASCLFFSFFITLVMSISSMTHDFDAFFRYSSLRDDNPSSIKLVIEFFFLNWISTSFYLLCWMMLYIGITSRRKTKQIEIDNLRLQISLKEAELNSLSNQLNPHFLFNALNNIRFMIHSDANNAEKMLMSLSSVLRYSLDSSKNKKVPLKEELEISNRYIDLIQIQFEERLIFALDIPESLLDCQLPPMVLQMLLENAVKHGIDHIREGGTINLGAQLCESTLTITVCNDLPENYIKRLEEPGIGLFNIGQRIDLLYADQGSIDTQVIENRFCVTVKIPQEV